MVCSGESIWPAVGGGARPLKAFVLPALCGGVAGEKLRLIDRPADRLCLSGGDYKNAKREVNGMYDGERRKAECDGWR